MSRAFACDKSFFFNYYFGNKSEQMLELLFEEKLYMSNTIDDLLLSKGL